jgi:hypothetical protein
VLKYLDSVTSSKLVVLVVRFVSAMNENVLLILGFELLPNYFDSHGLVHLVADDGAQKASSAIGWPWLQCAISAHESIPFSLAGLSVPG